MGRFRNLEKLGAEVLLQRCSRAKWAPTAEPANKTGDGIWGNTQLLKTGL